MTWDNLAEAKARTTVIFVLRTFLFELPRLINSHTFYLSGNIKQLINVLIFLTYINSSCKLVIKKVE